MIARVRSVVDLERLQIAIDEYRQRVHQQDGVHRRHERVRRHDDFVAGPDAESRERGDEGARAVGGCEATPGAHERCVGLLERSDMLSTKPFAAANDTQECILLTRVRHGPRWERRATHRYAAQQRRA
jgi:hypothetical protein